MHKSDKIRAKPDIVFLSAGGGKSAPLGELSMVSLLGSYGNLDALTIARELDSQIENLLRESEA